MTSAVTVTTTFSLVCTGAGGSASATATVTVVNQPPIVSAGPDQVVVAGESVTLTGAGSSDPDGSIVLYAWSQRAGPPVALDDPASATPKFVAPNFGTTLTFSLSVTDNSGAFSAAPDTVDVTVQAGVTISGKVTFDRIPPSFNLGSGLDYSATRADPSRGILVQAIDPVTQAVRAATTTDSNGGYSLTVLANAPVVIRAVAEMTRAPPQPLPSWKFRVRDVAGDRGYSFDGPTIFSGSSGLTHDLHIPSGWDTATRQVSGTRHAAPFAILDTAYKLVTRLSAADFAGPLEFPELTFDWAATNPGDSTFYSREGGGANRRIHVAAEPNVDIDEYDEFVLAHEFGHYLDERFGRIDSVGGRHRFGDRLDMRLAFSEGLATAFAGMVLNTSIYRDVVGANQAQEGYFDIDRTSVVNPGWYSEGSVQAILWDLFDSTPEPDDTLSTGFAPLWQVLGGAQHDTDAATSIFSFVTALKEARPDLASATDRLVAAQDIVSSTMDIYGSTETNSAGGAPNVLPIYTPIAVGDTKILSSTHVFDPLGDGNKLSVHRLLRLSVPGPQSVRITITAARDPDARLFKRGVLVKAGTTSANEEFIASLVAGTYILDVYDFANSTGGTGMTTPITVSVATN